MKILVATNRTQGHRKNDFNHANDGEPVHFSIECDRARIDDGCGCLRSMSGVISAKATTTVLVADVGLDRAGYIQLLADFYGRAWGSLLTKQDITEEADELLRVAALFPTGSVLERRGDSISQRKE